MGRHRTFNADRFLDKFQGREPLIHGYVGIWCPGNPMDNAPDFAENRPFVQLLGRHSAQALLGKVSPDAHVVGVFPEGGQDPLGQVQDLEDAREPGMVLPGGPGEGPDAPVALLLHEPAVVLGPLPRGLLVHPVLEGPPGAFLGRPAGRQAGRGIAGDDGPPTALVNREVAVYHQHERRPVRHLVYVRVPGDGPLVGGRV